MAIVAQLIASSMSASVTPPCTRVGAPENSAGRSKVANTTSASVSWKNGTCSPRGLAGSHTKQRLSNPNREASSGSMGTCLLPLHQPPQLLGLLEGRLTGELTDRGRQCWVHVHELAELAQLDVLFDRQRELVDHLARRGREDVRPEDAALVGDHEDRPVGRGVGAGPVVVHEVLAPHFDVAFELVARLGLGHPGVGELGIGERAPGDAGHDLALPGEEHVPYRPDSLVRRGVGEEEPPGDVTAGVHRVDGGAAAVVDDDTFRAGLDTQLLEVEVFHVRATAHGYEELVGFPRRRFAVLGAVDDLLGAVPGYPFGLDVEAQVDPLLAEPLDKEIDEGGLVAGQDARALLEQGGRDAEAGEALDHLARDRAPADVDEARGRVGELEEVLAGHETGGLETLDVRYRGSTPGAQQDVAGVQLAVSGLGLDHDGGGSGEPGRAVDQVDPHVDETLGVVVGGGDRLLHGPDPLPDPGPIDGWLHGLEAPLV